MKHEAFGRWLILPILAVILFWSGASVKAADPVTTDCIIRDYKSEFTIRTDSSLDVTENLTVDCGDLPNKHGIFRVLPTKAPRAAGVFDETPVTLLGITDSQGQSYNYKTSTSSSDHTISWRIGDADTTVTGLNNYVISYHVKNAIEAAPDQKNDLWYWNLNGNFWEMTIEHYQALINWPDNIGQKEVTLAKEADVTSDIQPDNVNLQLFEGTYGSDTPTAGTTVEWTGEHQLKIERTTPMAPKEGITIAAQFPHGLVQLYQPTWWEKNGVAVLAALVVAANLLIPLLVFIILFLVWKKHGRDPKIRASIAPEFGPPGKMTPIELGALQHYGAVQPTLVTATMVDLARRGYLKVKEITQGTIIKSKDWELELVNDDLSGLANYEKTLLGGLFSAAPKKGDKVTLSSLKNSLSDTLKKVKEQVAAKLEKDGLVDKESKKWQTGLIVTVVITVFFGSALFIILPIAAVLTITFLIIFIILMPRRTPAGEERFQQLKGFLLYMKTAEKYRQQFFEQENIFERFLPYAVAFGLTGLWIKKCRGLYGDEQMMGHYPLWYVGGVPGNIGSLDSLAAGMDSVSSSVGQAVSSSSSSGGFGGGGFSGGGGGGGGGGSW